MNRESTYSRAAQLAVILLCALALKHFYSTASVNELRWILAPTTFLVELTSGVTFNFESHAGYMSSDRTFLIATSCAGINFLIAALLMLSLARLWRANLSWRFIPCALVLAYLATIVANTVRISTSLQLQQTPLEIGSLSSNQIHRLQGILVYFGFLLLLFLVTERISRPDRRLAEHHQSHSISSLTSNKGTGLLRRFIFPLLVYYATTLGMPLGNALYTRDLDAAFVEHSTFVLFAPLLLILALAGSRFIKYRTDALVSFGTKKAIHELHE
jgi:exosortase K